MHAGNSQEHGRWHKGLVAVCIGFCLLALSVGVAFGASGEEQSKDRSEPFLIPVGTSAGELDAMVQAASQAPIGPFADADAAAELPHSNLSRDEAAELLTAAFPSALDEAAGVYDGLEVEKFRSDHVAVIGSDEAGGSASLLTSLLPLRDEATGGVKEQVDLGLEPVAGDLQPVNPLVEVEIPSEIEEGIAELPDEGISISLAGDSERTATTISGDAAFYPNVARDSDLVVLPTPTGLETLTQLRSSDAPTTQSFNLDIPSGSTLEATEDGGAIVTKDGEPVIVVRPPTAMDAEGASVPVTMKVSGSMISLQVSPSAESTYPILVDPLYESWEWMNYNASTGLYSEWLPASNEFYLQPTNWNHYLGKHGLNLQANYGVVSPPAQASWNYYVPRYFSDYESLQQRPTSFIRKMTLSQVYFIMDSPTATNPHMTAGLWDSNKEAFASVATKNGAETAWANATIYLKNDSEYTTVKNGGISMTTYEGISYPRHGYVGQAVIELGDKDLPSWASLFGPSNWVNGTAQTLDYEIGDSGLGIHSIQVKAPRATGGSKLFVTSSQCIGNAANPCPRKVTAATRSLTYDPQQMAQGVNVITAIATDPVGNQSVEIPAKIKVDHLAPALDLSGNLTEQGTTGTNLSEYTLDYAASDGDDATAAAQPPFGTPGTGPGQLQRPMGMAVDAAGNVLVVDRENNRVVKYDSSGNFLSQFGSGGTGNGQFSDPRGIAITPAGNIWVTEVGNKRLQMFNSKGEFVRKFTYEGVYGVDKFVEPYGVASGPNETLWVTDPGSNKVYRFKEDGTFLNTASGLLAGVTLNLPVGIAVDAFGNAWVSMLGSDKIYQFDSSGKYVFGFGGLGSSNGQFNDPSGVAIAKSGNVFVLDSGNNRVQEFKPDGSFLRQFGSLGIANDQLKEPRGLAVGPGNQLLIADAGNRRISRWAHADQDPQSGAAKVEIKVDGASVKAQAPGCATKNCGVSGSWTLDADDYPAGQHKVEVLATDGVGITTIKTLNVETHGDLQAPAIGLSGSMTEQGTLGTTRPAYTIYVNATDPGLAEERKSGVAATTIKVDGQVVDAVSPGCPAGGCSISRQWTLNSNSYSAGPHTVEVLATDGAGRTATKTLAINIARDTTAPTFELGNAFYTAPEGWLEQKSYNYNATATDPDGYGVTSMTLKIDGVVIKSSSGTCQVGGCSRLLGFFGTTIDMSKYAGGAHPAELIATDGAGNTRKRSWDLNVNPDGVIEVSEATDTLEAVEATAPETTELTPVDGLVTDAPGEEGGNPQLVLEEGQLKSEGAPVPSTISLSPEDGFALETAALSEEEIMHEENIEIVPLGTSSGASDAEITDGSAAVISNSSVGTDTILRPAYDGLMTFKAIREAAAPESYSWTVKVGEEETLKLIDSQHAALVWDDGTQGLLITAQPAHGADGEAVPTSLSVGEGNVITQTVHHRNGGFVYPVVAGVGWLGGFQTEQAEVLNPAEEESDATVTLNVAPPELGGYESSGDGASASSIPKYRIKWGLPICAKLGCDFWERRFRGFHWINFKNAWYPSDREPFCGNYLGASAVIFDEECAWVGPNNQPICKRFSGGPMDPCTTLHITARTRFQAGHEVPPLPPKTNPFHIVMRAWGTGDIKVYNSDQICNPMRPECAGDFIVGN
jgi:streptogramin lyase